MLLELQCLVYIVQNCAIEVAAVQRACRTRLLHDHLVDALFLRRLGRRPLEEIDVAGHAVGVQSDHALALADDEGIVAAVTPATEGFAADGKRLVQTLVARPEIKRRPEYLDELNASHGVFGRDAQQGEHLTAAS